MLAVSLDGSNPVQLSEGLLVVEQVCGLILAFCPVIPPRGNHASKFCQHLALRKST
jgi:hypothetical protein